MLPEWNGAGAGANWPTREALKRREAEYRAEILSRINYAMDIWRKAEPASGTLVETYLRERGLTMPIPPSVRFARALKHKRSGMFFPTMVCAVQSPEGGVTGVHRTFLRVDGRTKAPVKPQKMMIGVCAGGAVRFGKEGERLGVGEGIENCLSGVQACPDLPVWAALSTSGLRAVVLPNCAREVVILADADDAGEEAARDAAIRWKREGRHVRIARPKWGLDFNDMLLADALSTEEEAV